MLGFTVGGLAPPFFVGGKCNDYLGMIGGKSMGFLSETNKKCPKN